MVSSSRGGADTPCVWLESVAGAAGESLMDRVSSSGSRGDKDVGPGELDTADAAVAGLQEDLGGLAAEVVAAGVVDAVPEAAGESPEVEPGQGLVAGEVCEGLGVVVASAQGSEVVGG